MSTYAGLSEHTKRMMEMATEGHKAEIDRLRKALSDLTSEAFYRWKDKVCDHEKGVCWCIAKQRMEAAKVALDANKQP